MASAYSHSAAWDARWHTRLPAGTKPSSASLDRRQRRPQRVVPMTDRAYGVYAAGRNGLPWSSPLLPLNGTASNGVQYGLHPSCPELQGLFNAGNPAIVSNVGPLIQPTTAGASQRRLHSLAAAIVFAHQPVDRVANGVSAIAERVRLGRKDRRSFSFSQGMTAKLAFNINVGGTNYWQQGQRARPMRLV